MLKAEDFETILCGRRRIANHRIPQLVVGSRQIPSNYIVVFNLYVPE